MSIVKGLDNIRNKGESRGGDFPRRRPWWITLKDKQKLEIRFLQELDEAAEGYDEEVGLGFLAVEHESPVDWKRRALCTSEEGQCLGCENGWKQKQKLYINVLVVDGLEKDQYFIDKEDPDAEYNETVGEPVVRVVSQGYGPQTIVPWLIEYAGDAGSITQQRFKLTRTGAGFNNTSYSLMPKGPLSDDDPEPSELDTFDLDEVVNHVPYESQPKFYKVDDEDVSTGDVDDDGEVW